MSFISLELPATLGLASCSILLGRSYYHTQSCRRPTQAGSCSQAHAHVAFSALPGEPFGRTTGSPLTLVPPRAEEGSEVAHCSLPVILVSSEVQLTASFAVRTLHHTHSQQRAS